MLAKRFPYLTTLILLWALLFLARLGEAQLKMDGMTYAALAKHILTTHDWKSLHYTRHVYPVFDVHPPLVVWLGAVFFKLFGVSVPVARLLPAVFALGTVVVVYFWGCLASGPWLGWTAGCLLLTTISYLKYASDFMLDGPLAFFMVAGAFCFLKVERDERAPLFTVLFGLCLAGGFLSKGVVVLPLLAATLLHGLLTRDTKEQVRATAHWAVGLIWAVMFLFPWLAFGGGIHFLETYWRSLTMGRVQPGPGTDHWLPMKVIMMTYWPWLPLLAWGTWRLRWSFLGGTRGMALLFVGIFLIAFSLPGLFYEHYFVPFYPFAALIAAGPLEAVSEGMREKWVRYLRYFIFAAAVLALILPFPIRAQRDDFVREASQALVKRCASREINQVLVSDHLAGQWLALATVSWETPWDALSVQLPVEPGPGEVLLTAKDESEASWRCLAPLAHEPYRICEPPGLGYCR